MVHVPTMAQLVNHQVAHQLGSQEHQAHIKAQGTAGTATSPAGALRADLHAIRSQVGITGQRRLIADGETDGHADRFWAAALAASAARTVYQPYEYRPASGARGGGGGGFLDEPEDRIEREPFRPALGARIRGAL